MSDANQRRSDDGRYHKIAKAGTPWLNLAGVAVAIPLVIWLVNSYRDDFRHMLSAVQTLTVTLATTVNEQTNVKASMKKLQQDVESLQQLVWGRAGDVE